MNELLQPIQTFLHNQTPDSWIETAIKPENLPVLLQDHCTCELKAAQSAALLIRKYAIDKTSGPLLLSWLKPYEDFVYRKLGDGCFSMAKNGLVGELKAKVDGQKSDQSKAVNQSILDKMGLPYTSLSAARYASGLLKHVSSYEPAALVDKLIIGAYIEARSCERFAKLAPLVDDELSRFYVSLLRSEARHYQDYLNLAQQIADSDAKLGGKIDDRVLRFGEIEAGLIDSPDSDFRFHSGVPV
jgi:tRNA-(ms[2]io[6]A)-hydroxylase